MYAAGEIFNKGTRVKFVEGGLELEVEEEETWVTQSLFSKPQRNMKHARIPRPHPYTGWFFNRLRPQKF